MGGPVTNRHVGLSRELIGPFKPNQRNGSCVKILPLLMMDKSQYACPLNACNCKPSIKKGKRLKVTGGL